MLAADAYSRAKRRARARVTEVPPRGAFDHHTTPPTQPMNPTHKHLALPHAQTPCAPIRRFPQLPRQSVVGHNEVNKRLHRCRSGLCNKPYTCDVLPMHAVEQNEPCGQFTTPPTQPTKPTHKHPALPPAVSLDCVGRASSQRSERLQRCGSGLCNRSLVTFVGWCAGLFACVGAWWQ